MEFTLINRYTSKFLICRVFKELEIILSDLKFEYPFFSNWLNKVCKELASSDKRAIIICFDKDILNIKGLAILKKDENEKKICTLRVMDSYRRRGIGTTLLTNSKRILEDDKPLMTVSGQHMKEFALFLRKNGFVLKDKVKSIYKRGAYEYFFNISYQHKTVLMSIKPKYADMIADGIKKIEFRKRIFADSVETVYVYSSSPVKQILGYFKITKIVKGTPEQLWNHFSDMGCMSSEDYISYYRNHKIGYGIMIKEFIKFTNVISPKSYNPLFRAPQSFCYIDNIEELEWLKGLSVTSYK